MAPGKVCITGATGRLGQVLTGVLMGSFPLCAIARTAPDPRLPKGLDVHAAVLTDEAALFQALAGAAHCVMILPDHPDAAHMAQSLVTAAQRAGVKRIVKISAHLASQTPPLSFGIEHAAADDIVRASGIETVIFRPAMFMQSVSLFLGDMAKGRMIAPVPSGKVALIDAYDIAAAVTIALEGNVAPGTYMLTGPEALSFKDIAAHISAWSGKLLKHLAPPRWVAGLAMRFDKSLDAFNRTRLLEFMAALEAGLEAPIYPELETIMGRPGRTFADLLSAVPAYDGTVPVFHERTTP